MAPPRCTEQEAATRLGSYTACAPGNRQSNRAVAACQVLLAVIGSTWLTATDERVVGGWTIQMTSFGWRSRLPLPATCGLYRSWWKARSCQVGKIYRRASPVSPAV